MHGDRPTDIVQRLNETGAVSSELRLAAVKEISELRRACRATARDILSLKGEPYARPSGCSRTDEAAAA
jgi:hypothetical protein